MIGSFQQGIFSVRMLAAYILDTSRQFVSVTASAEMNWQFWDYVFISPRWKRKDLLDFSVAVQISSNNPSSWLSSENKAEAAALQY